MTCRHCGAAIVGRRTNARYCSVACRTAYHQARARTRYASDPEYRAKIKTQVRDRSRERDLGVSPTTADRLAESQNRRCAICGAHESALADGLHLDHNHTTGRVRGLLCAKCNLGIGLFRDEPERLMRAADYLQRYDHMRAAAPSSVDF